MPLKRTWASVAFTLPAGDPRVAEARIVLLVDGMPKLAVVLAIGCSVLCACTTRETQVRYAPPTHEHRLQRIPDSAVLTVDGLESFHGSISGRLVPTRACRTVVMNVRHGEVVETKRGDAKGNALLMVAGAALVVASALLINASDRYSDVETCSEVHTEDWKGDLQHDTRCRSPRSNAVALGVSGGLLGAAGLLGGLIGFSRRATTTRIGDTSPLVERSDPEGPATACVNASSLEGLVVALQRGERVLDYAKIDRNSRFTLTVPEENNEGLDIIVAAVPSPLASEIPVGLRVGSYIDSSK